MRTAAADPIDSAQHLLCMCCCLAGARVGTALQPARASAACALTALGPQVAPWKTASKASHECTAPQHCRTVLPHSTPPTVLSMSCTHKHTCVWVPSTVGTRPLGFKGFLSLNAAPAQLKTPCVGASVRSVAGPVRLATPQQRDQRPRSSAASCRRPAPSASGHLRTQCQPRSAAATRALGVSPVIMPCILPIELRSALKHASTSFDTLAPSVQ